MQQQREQRPAEIALIVIVSLLIGLIVGGAVGFLVGRSTAQQIVQMPNVPPVATATLAPTSTLPATIPPTLVPPTAAPGMTDTPVPASATTAAPPAPATTGAATTEPSPPPAQTSTNGLAPTIPIPVARTVTPVPPISLDVTITDQMATDLAVEALRQNPAGRVLSAPQVRFTNDIIELTGATNDPTGTIGSGPLLVRARPKVVEPNLRVEIEEATIGGMPAPQSIVEMIEVMMNDIFRSALSDRRVEQVSIAEGQITVTVVQSSQ